MCIRDRVELQLGLVDKLLNGPTGIFCSDVVRWGDIIHQNACLLYTSDAADERSSVDLGGRRIIKKKKQGQLWASEVKDKRHNYNNNNKVKQEAIKKKKSENREV